MRARLCRLSGEVKREEAMGLEIAPWGVVFISEPGKESRFTHVLSDLIASGGYPTDTPYCCHAHVFPARTHSQARTCTHISTHTQVLALCLCLSLSLF